MAAAVAVVAAAVVVVVVVCKVMYHLSVASALVPRYMTHSSHKNFAQSTSLIDMIIGAVINGFSKPQQTVAHAF